MSAPTSYTPSPSSAAGSGSGVGAGAPAVADGVAEAVPADALGDGEGGAVVDPVDPVEVPEAEGATGAPDGRRAPTLRRPAPQPPPGPRRASSGTTGARRPAGGRAGPGDDRQPPRRSLLATRSRRTPRLGRRCAQRSLDGSTDLLRRNVTPGLPQDHPHPPTIRRPMGAAGRSPEATCRPRSGALPGGRTASSRVVVWGSHPALLVAPGNRAVSTSQPLKGTRHGSHLVPGLPLRQ